MPTNTKISYKITNYQPHTAKPPSVSKWWTLCTRQHLGREHSILQYLTVTLDIYQICPDVGHCVNKKASVRWQPARRQFQAIGQPVSRTQASDAMTSRLARYDAKCVQRRCFQCGSVPLHSDIKGTELLLANILIPLKRQLIALQLCCWQFLYNADFCIGYAEYPPYFYFRSSWPTDQG